VSEKIGRRDRTPRMHQYSLMAHMKRKEKEIQAEKYLQPNY